MGEAIKGDRIRVMAKRSFTLTPEQRAELRQAYEGTNKPQEQRYFQAVRLYGEGWSVESIQDVTGCSYPTLMRWVGRYRRTGLVGLRWQVRGGNRARLTKQQRAEVKEKLYQYRPDQLLSAEERHANLPFWTVEDLLLLVERWYGVRFNSRTSYRTLLHEGGFSLQRVGTRYRSRPSVATIAEAEAQLEKK
jgi:transposase